MAQQPITKYGKRRRNFYLPDTLMAEVNEFASKKGVTMTDVLITALMSYFAAVKRKEAQGASTGH